VDPEQADETQLDREVGDAQMEDHALVAVGYAEDQQDDYGLQSILAPPYALMDYSYSTCTAKATPSTSRPSHTPAPELGSSNTAVSCEYQNRNFHFECNK
jgi:hypothetical protein